MIDKHLRVDQMPSAVMKACIERGHAPYDEMSVSDAMAEWMGWEIGDPGRGRSAAEYVAAMITL